MLNVAEGSGTAKAIDYSLKRWPALCRYATAGHLPIDNNPIENDIRPIAIGKKNWLFTGSERAGKRAAAIQSSGPLHRKTQRTRSGSLAARHPGKTADLPEQPDRFAAAAAHLSPTTLIAVHQGGRVERLPPSDGRCLKRSAYVRGRPAKNGQVLSLRALQDRASERQVQTP